MWPYRTAASTPYVSIVVDVWSTNEMVATTSSLGSEVAEGGFDVKCPPPLSSTHVRDDALGSELRMRFATPAVVTRYQMCCARSVAYLNLPSEITLEYMHALVQNAHLANLLPLSSLFEMF